MKVFDIRLRSANNGDTHDVEPNAANGIMVHEVTGRDSTIRSLLPGVHRLFGIKGIDIPFTGAPRLYLDHHDGIIGFIEADKVSFSLRAAIRVLEHPISPLLKI